MSSSSSTDKLDELRKARPFLLRAWELSGEGAFGTIAQALSRVDAELSATPALAPSSTSATTVYQAPSGFKLLPKEPTDAMLNAIDAYFAKWQGIVGGSDTARKADCWSALQVYHRMYETAEISETLAPSATGATLTKDEATAILEVVGLGCDLLSEDLMEKLREGSK